MPLLRHKPPFNMQSRAGIWLGMATHKRASNPMKEYVAILPRETTWEVVRTLALDVRCHHTGASIRDA